MSISGFIGKVDRFKRRSFFRNLKRKGILKDFQGKKINFGGYKSNISYVNKSA